MQLPDNNRRGIDVSLAALSGEASGQKADLQCAPAFETWREMPGSQTGAVTYYDQPLLKQSVWGIDIPLYYFVGGAAGAALTLGAAIQLVARDRHFARELRKLSATSHWIGIVGSTVGAAFLIHDLGRPSRFLNMMRVFRPTSPMNMGVWILAGAAPTAIATGLLINRGGWLGRVGEATGYASGLFGAALSGYTAVLVSNSVIPVWQDARRWMPPQFVASSMSAAAGVLQLFPLGSRADRITRVFGAIGRTADLAAAKLVETSASVTPRVSEPFRRGLPSTLWKAASILTGVSLALTLIPRKSQTVRRLAGACGLAGSLCLRLAVHTITQASARDARASFDQQRDRPALSR